MLKLIQSIGVGLIVFLICNLTIFAIKNIFFNQSNINGVFFSLTLGIFFSVMSFLRKPNK